MATDLEKTAAKLISEYRSTMSADGLHLWAIDAAAAMAGLSENNAVLREALSFYRDNWAYTTLRNRPGLEWHPKEQLLDDCGNVAATVLGPRCST